MRCDQKLHWQLSPGAWLHSPDHGAIRSRPINEACAQGQDGKVKPIPYDEDFARPGTSGQEAADLTLAVHMQQEELLTGHPYSPGIGSPHR